MGTRCNVIVEMHASRSVSRVYLYRHWDGYLAETGADLAKKLSAAAKPQSIARGFAPFLQALINEKRGGEAAHDRDRAQYEITDQKHGDIDHCYTISFKVNNVHPGNYSVSIKHEWRTKGEWNAATYTPDEFIERVNADRVETNKRIAEINGRAKTTYDKYPMLELRDGVLQDATA